MICAHCDALPTVEIGPKEQTLISRIWRIKWILPNRVAREKFAVDPIDMMRSIRMIRQIRSIVLALSTRSPPIRYVLLPGSPPSTTPRAGRLLDHSALVELNPQQPVADRGNLLRFTPRGFKRRELGANHVALRIFMHRNFQRESLGLC